MIFSIKEVRLCAQKTKMYHNQLSFYSTWDTKLCQQHKVAKVVILGQGYEDKKGE